MEPSIRQGQKRSRRSFLRLAGVAMVTAIPTIKALAVPENARAFNICEDVVCGCSGCKGTCGYFACRADCFDAHDGEYCGSYCTGDRSCAANCTFC